jgi:hypothetical protein
MRETPIGIGQHRPNGRAGRLPAYPRCLRRDAFWRPAYRRLLENQHFFSSVNHLTPLA